MRCLNVCHCEIQHLYTNFYSSSVFIQDPVCMALIIGNASLQLINSSAHLVYSKIGKNQIFPFFTQKSYIN